MPKAFYVFVVLVVCTAFMAFMPMDVEGRSPGVKPPGFKSLVVKGVKRTLQQEPSRRFVTAEPRRFHPNTIPPKSPIFTQGRCYSTKQTLGCKPHKTSVTLPSDQLQ